jgi:hypothetical protein
MIRDQVNARETGRDLLLDDERDRDFFGDLPLLTEDTSTSLAFGSLLLFFCFDFFPRSLLPCSPFPLPLLDPEDGFFLSPSLAPLPSAHKSGDWCRGGLLCDAVAPATM